MNEKERQEQTKLLDRIARLEVELRRASQALTLIADVTELPTDEVRAKLKEYAVKMRAFADGAP